MYRGTIYIDSLQKNRLLEYLEDTGWIIEEDEVFKRKGIRVITLSNDYNEITVQFEKHQKIEIDGLKLEGYLFQPIVLDKNNIATYKELLYK